MHCQAHGKHLNKVVISYFFVWAWLCFCPWWWQSGTSIASSKRLATTGQSSISMASPRDPEVAGHFITSCLLPTVTSCHMSSSCASATSLIKGLIPSPFPPFLFSISPPLSQNKPPRWDLSHGVTLWIPLLRSDTWGIWEPLWVKISDLCPAKWVGVGGGVSSLRWLFNVTAFLYCGKWNTSFRHYSVKPRLDDIPWNCSSLYPGWTRATQTLGEWGDIFQESTLLAGPGGLGMLHFHEKGFQAFKPEIEERR